MRYGVWFFAFALLILSFQLTAVFKLVERRLYECEMDFKKPLNVKLPLFKNHQKQCSVCLGIIDNESVMPCRTGFNLIYEDNRKAGF